MNFEYHETSSECATLLLKGEMDAEGCVKLRPTLEELVEKDIHTHVVIDFTDVTFLDSSGIGAIVFLFKRLKTAKRSMEIVGAQGQPSELMKLLRIDKAIPVTISDSTASTAELHKCTI